MKSFIQFITERPAKLSVGQLYRASLPRETRGHINPNEQDLARYIQNTKYNEVRILVDKKGTLYVWDAEEALHQEIISGEGLFKDDVMVGVVAYNGNRNAVSRLIGGWLIQLSRKGGRDKYAKKNKTLATLMKDKENEVTTY